MLGAGCQGGEGRATRGVRDAMGMGWSYQVSSSSSKKVSWGAIVAEGRAGREREKDAAVARVEIGGGDREVGRLGGNYDGTSQGEEGGRY